MKKYFVRLLILSVPILFFYGCSKGDKVIEGDLYFPVFKFGSFYDVEDSTVQQAKLYMDTVHSANLDSSGKKIFDMYAVLKKKGLLYSPFVYIKIDSTTTVWLYLDKTDYDKLKIYHHKDLRDENKKIRIKFSAQSMQYGMYLCKSLINVNKVDGQTGVQGRKWRIEDYH